MVTGPTKEVVSIRRKRPSAGSSYQWRGMLSVLVGAIGGWYLGLVAYRWALAVVLNQRASGGDLRALGLWISVGLAVTLLVVYLPLIGWLHSHFGKAPVRCVVGLLCGALIAPVPASVVMIGWGGGISTLWSAEARLMWVWTGIGGALIVAAGALYPRRSADDRE